MLDPDTLVGDKTFEELCIISFGSRDDYLETHKFVKAYIFSRYPGRRQYAIAKLREYWDSPVEVETVMDDGYLVSLIRLNPDENWCVVGRYEPGPISEEVPSKEEISSWPS